MSQKNTLHIANNIRRIRESKAYSQEYMAAKMGISQNGYSKIELNYTRLTVERLLAIATLLETDAIDLMRAEDIKAA